MRRILCVGLDLASDAVDRVDFDSRASLLDWDIILFRPSLSAEFDPFSTFQGRPSYSEEASFRVKESCEHWRRQIGEAADAGKVVVVFLPSLESVYVDSGRREYSGTGRNRQTTRIVESFDNYRAIPGSLGAVNTEGSAMKLTPRGASLSAYWEEFGALSTYKVVLSAPNMPAAVATKSGDRPVGAIYRSKTTAGAVVLLPDLPFGDSSFMKLRNGEHHWTSKATAFAARLISAIAQLDEAVRNVGEVTPPPIWGLEAAYEVAGEGDLRSRLLLAEAEIEEAVRRKESVQSELQDVASHRRLLFEKGKPLEAAIVRALVVLGFHAAPYRDAESEFDVVFESEEGRLIGEAEGKDNKAVNIDKLRQLHMNVQEDLRREEVSAPAKPVLFGNGYRLSVPSERGDAFTAKTIAAAKSTSTALVSTPELFGAVRHVLATRDAAFARECRQAILSAAGVVAFPQPTAIHTQATPEVRVDA